MRNVRSNRKHSHGSPQPRRQQSVATSSLLSSSQRVDAVVKPVEQVLRIPLIASDSRHKSNLVPAVFSIWCILSFFGPRHARSFQRVVSILFFHPPFSTLPCNRIQPLGLSSVYPQTSVEVQKSNKEFEVVHWFAEQALSCESCSADLVMVWPEDVGGHQSTGPASPWCRVLQSVCRWRVCVMPGTALHIDARSPELKRTPDGDTVYLWIMPPPAVSGLATIANDSRSSLQRWPTSSHLLLPQSSIPRKA